jgi:hypothetical protein
MNSGPFLRQTYNIPPKKTELKNISRAKEMYEITNQNTSEDWYVGKTTRNKKKSTIKAE